MNKSLVGVSWQRAPELGGYFRRTRYSDAEVQAQTAHVEPRTPED